MELATKSKRSFIYLMIAGTNYMTKTTDAIQHRKHIKNINTVQKRLKNQAPTFSFQAHLALSCSSSTRVPRTTNYFFQKWNTSGLSVRITSGKNDWCNWHAWSSWVCMLYECASSSKLIWENKKPSFSYGFLNFLEIAVISETKKHAFSLCFLYLFDMWDCSECKKHSFSVCLLRISLALRLIFASNSSSELMWNLLKFWCKKNRLLPIQSQGIIGLLRGGIRAVFVWMVLVYKTLLCIE